MVNEYKLREFEEDIDLVKTHGSKYLHLRAVML